ncbi:MAG: hypothetical protein WCG92_16165 [Hyphomicrobiales bacterium]
MQRRQRGVVVLHQNGFGDFQFEPVRRKPGFRKDGCDDQGEAGMTELNRRHVEVSLVYL